MNNWIPVVGLTNDEESDDTYIDGVNTKTIIPLLDVFHRILNSGVDFKDNRDGTYSFCSPTKVMISAKQFDAVIEFMGTERG